MNGIAVSASAGSGKTFALSTRFVAMALSNNIFEILAITFTNKAVAEMKTRIVDTFLNLQNLDAELDVVSKILSISKDEIIKIRDSKKDEFLSTELKILTFDAFFSQILRNFSLRFGISPDFVIDDEINKFHKELFFDEILKNHCDEFITFLHTTNFSKDGFFELLQNIYKNNIKIPNNIDDKELQSSEVIESLIRIQGELKELLKQKNDKRVNNFANKNFTTIDEILENLDFLSKKYFIKFLEMSPNLCDITNEFKANLQNYITSYESFIFSKIYKFLEIFQNTRARVIRKHNKFCFEDVVKFCKNLLCGSDFDENLFYFKLDSKIKHILIDEFQDTSVIQYEIIKPLLSEIFSGSGQKGHNRSLFYVGDKKQSIYGFRGGKKELFDYLGANSAINRITLDTNYRSLKLLVDFINEIFKLDADRQKSSDKKNNSLIKGYEKDALDYIKNLKDRSIQLNDEQNLSIYDNSFGYIKVKKFGNDWLKSVYDEIINLTNSGAKFNKIAVLLTKNSDTKELRDYLLSNKIPASIDIDENLLELNEIKAIMNYLKFFFTKEKIYYENTAKLLGFYPKKIDLDISKSILDNLNFVCEILCIDKNNPNLLDFFEIACGYKNLIELIFDDRSKNQAKFKDLKGVKILTIHKSKGLEFAHIIVCDELSRPRNDTDKIIYDYDLLNDKFRLFYKMKNRDLIDSNFANFKEFKRKNSLEEKRNLLYVALSRAQKSLIILQNDITDDNNPYNSAKSYFFDKFNKEGVQTNYKIFALNEFEIGKIIPDTTTQIDDSLIEIKEFPKVSLQNKESNEKISIDYASSFFGSGLHYILENLLDFDEKSLELSFVICKNKFREFLTDEQFNDMKNRVKLLINNEKFKNLIKYREILKEESFKFNNEIYRIDLLLKKTDEILIIDYKSSNSNIQKNITQVSDYMDKIQKFYPNHKISGLIIFLKFDSIDFLEI